MISIALDRLDTGTSTPSELSAHLRPLLRRLTAWRRHRNYPTVRRARREALFTWSAAVVRHTSVRN